MEKDSFVDCERKRLYKVINFRLPSQFVGIGLVICVLTTAINVFLELLLWMVVIQNG